MLRVINVSLKHCRLRRRPRSIFNNLAKLWAAIEPLKFKQKSIEASHAEIYQPSHYKKLVKRSMDHIIL